MNKRVLVSVLIIFVVLILVSRVSASKDNISIDLSVDYDSDVTENKYVTLGLHLDGEEIDYSNISVKFSLDNKTWKGYDINKDKWVRGLDSEYQDYYPDFYIGSSEGLKIIYVKITDNNDKTFITSSTIYYSPQDKRPIIHNPISVHNPSYNSSYYKGNIYQGGGIKSNPYYVNNTNTRIILDCSNSKSVSYSLDGISFSKWIDIKDNKIDVDINLENSQGEKLVYVKTKNSYGIESDIKSLYFIYDSSLPNLNIHYSNGNNLDISNYSFDILVSDNLSKKIEFKLELSKNGSMISKSGETKVYKNQSTTIPIKIDGLSKGFYSGKITVKDGAGNKVIKTIRIGN